MTHAICAFARRDRSRDEGPSSVVTGLRLALLLLFVVVTSVAAAPPEGRYAFGLRLQDGSLAWQLPPFGSYLVDVEADGRGGWFVAGDFTSIGGVDCPALAHVLDSGEVDAHWCAHITSEPFEGKVYAEVRLLARAGETLYIVGSFDSVGGEVRRGYAAIDTKTAAVKPWQPRGGAYADEALAAGGGRVFLGAAGEPPSARATLFAVDANTGRQLWKLRLDNRGCRYDHCWGHVGAILVRGASVYVAGSFRHVLGLKHVGLVALDARTARPLAWRANVNESAVSPLSPEDTPPWQLAAVGRTVYVGGNEGLLELATVNGVRRYGIAALDARTGEVRRWKYRGYVEAFAVSASAVVLADGGSIVRVDRVSGRQIRWRSRMRGDLDLLGDLDLVDISDGNVLASSYVSTPHARSRR
jgi:outer membrane protein assembly factor BamB